MGKTILVTYASRTGTTADVAGRIGEILTRTGVTADVIPMKDVINPGKYDAIIAGSSIQASKWLPEAMEFVEKHRLVLNQKPFAMFAVCMTLAMKKGEDYRPAVAGWCAPVRQLVMPFAEGYFAGALDIKKIPSASDRLKFKLSVLFRVWKEGDHRNWDKIEEWALSLTEVLKSE